MMDLLQYCLTAAKYFNNGAVAFSADRFKGLKWHKTKLVKYMPNKLTLKSAFSADFLYLMPLKLSAKLTARRTNVRRRARRNVYKSTFHFVSRILHLNPFSPLHLIGDTSKYRENNSKNDLTKPFLG